MITSSTAQGSGGSFKNRKPIGEVGSCESGMAKRSHWCTERWLISLTISLSFSDYPPTYLPTYLSIYLSLCVCLSIYLSINLSIYLSIWLCVVVFYVLRATTACNFSALIWPDGSAPAALASLLFDSPEPRCIEKHRVLPDNRRISMRTCSSMDFETTIRLYKLSGFGKPPILCVNPGYLSKPYKNFGFEYVGYLVCLSVYVSTHLCLYLSWCLTICLCVHVSICLSRHLCL